MASIHDVGIASRLLSRSADGNCILTFADLTVYATAIVSVFTRCTEILVHVNGFVGLLMEHCLLKISSHISNEFACVIVFMSENSDFDHVTTYSTRSCALHPSGFEPHRVVSCSHTAPSGVEPHRVVSNRAEYLFSYKVRDCVVGHCLNIASLCDLCLVGGCCQRQCSTYCEGKCHGE